MKQLCKARIKEHNHKSLLQVLYKQGYISSFVAPADKMDCNMYETKKYFVFLTTFGILWNCAYTQIYVNEGISVIPRKIWLKMERACGHPSVRKVIHHNLNRLLRHLGLRVYLQLPLNQVIK